MSANVRSIRTTLNDFYETVAYGLFYADDDDDVEDPNGYGTPYLYLIYKNLEEQVVNNYYPEGEYEGQDISVAVGDQIDSIQSNFTWATDAGNTFINNLQAIFSDGETGTTTTITITPSLNTRFFNGLNGKTLSISNSFWTPYKNFVDTILSAFIYLGFMVWFVRSLPSFLNGGFSMGKSILQGEDRIERDTQRAIEREQRRSRG